jgi:hypothetical protein
LSAQAFEFTMVDGSDKLRARHFGESSAKISKHRLRIERLHRVKRLAIAKAKSMRIEQSDRFGFLMTCTIEIEMFLKVYRSYKT